jgi:hypothetical protein
MILGNNFMNGGASFPAQPMGAGNDGDLFWRTDQKTLYYWDTTSGGWILVPGVPVGSIIAWTNHLTGTPSLPANFHVCDGTNISDPESPMNGQPLPNLSANPTFLGGYSTSNNTPVAANMPYHTHAVGTLQFSGTPHQHQVGISTLTGVYSAVSANNRAASFNNGFTSSVTAGGTISGSTGTPNVGSALNNTNNYPLHMQVIWVMRIK